MIRFTAAAGLPADMRDALRTKGGDVLVRDEGLIVDPLGRVLAGPDLVAR